MKIRKIFVSLVTAGLALTAYVSAVGAAEISGVKFEDKITVAGKTLVLNGLGVRQILFFKGYAAALGRCAGAVAATHTMTKKSGKDLFIVDNSDDDWKVLNYLAEWTDISNKFDIATG